MSETVHLLRIIFTSTSLPCAGHAFHQTDAGSAEAAVVVIPGGLDGTRSLAIMLAGAQDEIVVWSKAHGSIQGMLGP